MAASRGAARARALPVGRGPGLGGASAPVPGRGGRGLGVAARAGAGAGPVVVVDNYDSFTYNLCQYMGELGGEYVVVKNDERTVDELRAMEPRGVMVSPGPGTPEDSGISLAVVRDLSREVPVFGVCMGHQCIGQVFGGGWSFLSPPAPLSHPARRALTAPPPQGT